MIHRIAHAVKKKPEPPRAPTTLQPMRLIPLMQTGTRWCKWPVTHDPGVIGGFLCCGRATPADHVYCSEHRAIASATGSPRLPP